MHFLLIELVKLLLSTSFGLSSLEGQPEEQFNKKIVVKILERSGDIKSRVEYFKLLHTHSVRDNLLHFFVSKVLHGKLKFLTERNLFVCA